MRGGDHGWGTTDLERTTYTYAGRRQPQTNNAIPAAYPLSKGKCLHGINMSEHCAACAKVD